MNHPFLTVTNKSISILIEIQSKYESLKQPEEKFLNR